MFFFNQSYYPVLMPPGELQIFFAWNVIIRVLYFDGEYVLITHPGLS